MSGSAAPRLIPKLRYNVHDRRKLKQPQGPKGRHDRIRKIVTALFKHERIECKYGEGDESRGYAERLLADAIRYGDCHQPTMEMASYWILEKQLIHKLFKVMVPKYRNYDKSFTKLWKAPYDYPGRQSPNCVLEFRDNVYPPLGPDKTNHKNLIHNILLSEAKKFFDKEKQLKLKRFEIERKASITTKPLENIKPKELSKEEVLKTGSVKPENASSEGLKESASAEVSQELSQKAENTNSEGLKESTSVEVSQELSQKAENASSEGLKESTSVEVSQELSQKEDSVESLDLDKMKVKEESSNVEKEKK